MLRRGAGIGIGAGIASGGGPMPGGGSMPVRRGPRAGKGSGNLAAGHHHRQQACAGQEPAAGASRLHPNALHAALTSSLRRVRPWEKENCFQPYLEAALGRACPLRAETRAAGGQGKERAAVGRSWRVGQPRKGRWAKGAHNQALKSSSSIRAMKPAMIAHTERCSTRLIAQFCSDSCLFGPVVVPDIGEECLYREWQPFGIGVV